MQYRENNTHHSNPSPTGGDKILRTFLTRNEERGCLCFSPAQVKKVK